MRNLKLTLWQIELMRHAIGLGTEKLKKRSYKAYRNYTLLNGEDKDWEYLVEMGLAEKKKYEIEDKVGYYVTEKGTKYLTCLFGCIIKLEY